jgi:hypothetical protein
MVLSFSPLKSFSFRLDDEERKRDVGNPGIRPGISPELARIRKKLGLTQKEAAMIAGGGHNAFSRYERV